jgi:hypothetical protein
MSDSRQQPYTWQHWVTMATVLGAVLIVVFFLVRHNAPDLFDRDDGAVYARKLEAEIRAAERIVVTEHSHEGDYRFTKPRVLEPPEVEYARVELDAAARRRFADRIATMDTAVSDMSSSCVLEPHHTIAFYRDGKLSSSLRVCFVCDLFEWDGTSREPPAVMMDVLTPTVAETGLNTTRDYDYWYALAGADIPSEDSEAAP